MSLKRNPVIGTNLRPPPQFSIRPTLRRPRRRKRTKYNYPLIHSSSSSNHNLISSSYPSNHNFFHLFLSQLDLLTPALGFTTALALLHKFNSTNHREIGEWSLFTSPTPFNRFIKLRCASLLLEDSNEKLVKEDEHVVSFDTGRIRRIYNNDYTDGHVLGEQVFYQRICVNTDDGGVVALDWPANLELTLEHGLDTTVLIVPGTTDGSMDEDVRSFVSECLTHGCFPIVMNPRGCARSPLITPRLFTAADSDDICTAVQFINRARPWTTFMGVGFGYGSNMLTKYLAEVGEETPLTAAACLDNPFDLKKASNHLYVDQNLTSGLIDMLQSNKELFMGRSKGFDVEKALQAKSLEEFEEAVSMVSYGCNSIEEFYVSSSTRDVVGNVKIPLLFIQNNAMASFSTPRSLIAENPFTSLLICTLQSNDKSTTGTSDVSWCRHLVVEWLTAVELGLLKGRHPLLEDSDVTITPSKQVTSHGSGISNNFPKFLQLDGNGLHSREKMLKRSDEYVDSSFGRDIQMSKAKDKDTANGMVTQTNLVDLKEGDVDSERGKVLQATEVVMNMLDVTMPEALSEEQKLKVLTAVSQGETLMNALQDAVPEDVRGKLTSSVTTILENQKKNLNGLSHVSDGASALNKKMQERSVGLSNVEKERNALEHDTNLTEKDTNNHPRSKNDASEPADAHTLGNSDGGSQLQTTRHQDGEISTSGTTSNRDQMGSNDSKEKDAQFQNSDSSVMSDISRKVERPEDHIIDQANLGLEGGSNVEKEDQHKGVSKYSTDLSTLPQTEKTAASSIEMAKEDGENQKTEDGKNQKKEDAENQKKDDVENRKKEDDENQRKDDVENRKMEDGENQRKDDVENRKMEDGENRKKDDGENQKREESGPQPVSSSNSSSFSVSQALDALSGMDDSTQLAVNSVFSVIEDVITQLEGNRDNGSAADDNNNTSTDSEREAAAQPQNGGDGKPSMTTELKEASHHQQSMSISTEKKDEDSKNDDDVRHSITRIPYRSSLYDHYVQSHLYSKMKNDKLLQSDAATALYLDYVPEEGQWKLLERSREGTNYVDDVPSHERILPSNVECNNDVVEPTYVILEAEADRDPVGEYKGIDQTKETLEIGDVASVQLLQFVKENILKSLEVEVSRRIQTTDMADIALVLKNELENVAYSISLAVVHDNHHVISWDGEKLVGLGNLQDEHLVDAISSAVQGTRYMKEVVPVGIVVGSSLASLRKIGNINTADSLRGTEAVTDQISDPQEGYHLQADSMASDEIALDEVNQDNYSEDKEKHVSRSLGGDTVMVGAVTAALGASALLVHQQNSFSDELESSTSSSLSLDQKENHQEHGKPEEEMSKSGDNLVTSIAEKAMLVAGPVMPTKEDGGVDQDRLVAILADLGQKGGILKLVGKVALLWGGIRGAMSLTGKLISFLRLAERPLFQRILGFVCMVIVLWTPVVVPLLPTLVQNWAAHNSSKFAELACIIGLYSSIMILVVLWGKRIRGYEDPLERYGLELTSARQIQNFAFGLIGGVMLVLLIQYTNVLLGFVSLSLPTIPSSSDPVTLLKLIGKVLRFVGQGLVTAVAIALVEELLFRSWLPEEIAVDFGYNQGIILSGLAFALSQWSLKAIPGLWLLSVGLAGVRQRCQGRLSIPIGLRAGIIASSFVLKEGGFLIYQQHKTTTYPLWLSGGGDPFQPFNNIVGLAVAFLWALFFYPKNPQIAEEPNKLKESIME
ncbi:hypothetical protein QVD17_26569 [Tagetes erecta]|uniref:Embryogenesis-associated protein EMB8 n=1 Tax=Tagetes erecta TaxID=13708 RepID=A0AAD8K760_TARER|nr:hypothetical protein QVD17_26569 [Tagetes erecta]